MADEPKKASDRFAGWKKPGAPQVASAGGSQDILKKALALNPNLKGDKSTREFMDEVGEAKRKGAQSKQVPVATPAANPGLVQKPPPEAKQSATLAERLADIKAWLDDEAKRLATAIADHAEAEVAAEAEAAQATQAMRDRVVELVASVDPNILSPKTQALLDEESPFLDQLGFHKDLVIARARRR